MKKLLFYGTLLALLVFSSINSQAQVFVTLNPAQGFGHPGLLLNVNQPDIEKGHLITNLGFYSTINGGTVNYTYNYFSEVYTFKANQFKVGAGFSYKYRKGVDILLGIFYTDIYKYNDTPLIDPTRVKKWSPALGFTGMVTDKWSVCFLTDVINWETSLGISIHFNRYN